MSELVSIHHGIKGQKWGIRRFQNKDGSLTPAGRKRVAKLESQYMALTGRKIKNQSAKQKPKTIEERTKELQSQKAYLQTQKDILDLNRQIESLKPDTRSAGRKFIEKNVPAIGKIVWDSVGKNTVQKVIDKKLGLDEKSASEKLAQQETDSQRIKRERDDQQNRYYREFYKNQTEELLKEKRKKK